MKVHQKENVSSHKAKEEGARKSRRVFGSIGQSFSPPTNEVAGGENQKTMKVVNEWFHGPVDSAIRGVKSITMCHERVMILFLPSSFVVSNKTGPGSMNINAFSIDNSTIVIIVPPLFCQLYQGRSVVTNATIDLESQPIFCGSVSILECSKW